MVVSMVELPEVSVETRASVVMADEEPETRVVVAVAVLVAVAVAVPLPEPETEPVAVPDMVDMPLESTEVQTALPAETTWARIASPQACSVQSRIP